MYPLKQHKGSNNRGSNQTCQSLLAAGFQVSRHAGTCCTPLVELTYYQTIRGRTQRARGRPSPFLSNPMVVKSRAQSPWLIELSAMQLYEHSSPRNPRHVWPLPTCAVSPFLMFFQLAALLSPNSEKTKHDSLTTVQMGVAQKYRNGTLVNGKDQSTICAWNNMCVS